MRDLQKHFLGFESGIVPAALSLVELLENCFQINANKLRYLNNFPNPFAVILSTLQRERACRRLRCRLGDCVSDLCGRSVRARALK